MTQELCKYVSELIYFYIEEDTTEDEDILINQLIGQYLSDIVYKMYTERLDNVELKKTINDAIYDIFRLLSKNDILLNLHFAADPRILSTHIHSYIVSHEDLIIDGY